MRMIVANYRYSSGEYDYTFKFYTDNSVKIIDNNSEAEVFPGELRGEVLNYYRSKINKYNVNIA